MADASIQADIEDAYETELSRLGSSKALYALTEGEMETDVVLAALAGRATAAADTFETWADDDSHGEFFAESAEMAREHADRIRGMGASSPADESPGQVADALGRQTDPDARLGGLLAWALVTDRALSQAVGFFVGNADTKAADSIRALRSDVEERLSETLDRLDGADREVALAAANQVVEAAYDEYVRTLEGLGVKVKPVC